MFGNKGLMHERNVTIPSSELPVSGYEGIISAHRHPFVSMQSYKIINYNH